MAEVLLVWRDMHQWGGHPSIVAICADEKAAATAVAEQMGFIEANGASDIEWQQLALDEHDGIYGVVQARSQYGHFVSVQRAPVLAT